jgi:hypothetical protein
MPTYGICRGKAQRAQQRRPDLHQLLLNRFRGAPVALQ